MIPPYSWSVPGRKPGTSTNVTSGMLNASQVRTKRAAFSGGAVVGRPRHDLRLVPDDSDHVAVEAGEPAHDVHGPQRVDFEEVPVVHDLGDDRLHVIRLVGGVRDQVDDAVAAAVGIVF